MAQLKFFRAFDIQKQINLADWTEATWGGTARVVTLRLGNASIALNGSFLLIDGTPVSGSIQGLSYYTDAGAPVLQFEVTELSLDLNDIHAALADGDLSAIFGHGSDLLSGTAGNERLYGQAGDDRLEGNGGNDTLIGSYGNDTLDGGSGNDVMQGGSGDDLYIVDSSSDRILEGAGQGIDTVRTTLKSYGLGAQFENVVYVGSAGFTGTGNALDNLIAGGIGRDFLAGHEGGDTLHGGNGGDTLDGGGGNDALVGDTGFDAVASSASGFSPGNPSTPWTLSMSLPELSASASATLSGLISHARSDGTAINIAVAIDISSDGASSFAGAEVGDLNGDGISNTRLDAEILCFNALMDSLHQAGLDGKVQVALIPFSSTLGTVTVGMLGTDANGNGMADVMDAAKALRSVSSWASYGAGLDGAIDFLRHAPSGSNHVYVLSGSYSSSVGLLPKLDELRDAAELHASIRSLAFPGMYSENLGDTLDIVDDGLVNYSVPFVVSAPAAAAAMRPPGLKVEDIDHLGIYRNGVLATTLAPSQLRESAVGLSYSVSIDGLSTTGADTIEVRLVWKDAPSSFMSVSQRISGAAFDSNDSLVGGAGNDTLDGGAGRDTLIGGEGNDSYRLYNTDAVIQEDIDQGSDTVMVDFSYSIRDAGLRNVENLVLLGSAPIAGTGSAVSNRIEGNAGNNVLSGLAGNDTIDGGAGVDIVSYADFAEGVVVNLRGGAVTAAGKLDQLYNVEGIWGSNFNDVLQGGDGDNSFRGLGGDDTFSGDYGFDTVDYSAATSGVTVSFVYYPSGGGYYGRARSADGGEGTDYIGYGMERIVGSSYGDEMASSVSMGIVFVGGAGNDTLTGGSGNDTLKGDAGNDVLQGGEGLGDTVDYSDSRVAISGSLATGKMSVGTAKAEVDTLGNIEHVLGTQYSDSVAGSLANNRLLGGAGNDTLKGDAGDDTMDGGTGNDSMVGGAGNDVYYVDSAGDLFMEGEAGGSDTVYIAINDRIITRNLAGVEIVHASGSSAYDLTGGAEQNLIECGNGNDTINGGIGSETDTLSGGLGLDWVSYAGHLTGVTSMLEGSQNIVGDRLSGFENLLGSSYSDVVTGSYGANLLDGAAGDDSLYGGSDNDTLVGGAGNDLLDGQYGSDTVSYAHLKSGITVDLGTGVAITASEGTDTLASIEHVIGTSSNDSIVWTGSGAPYNDLLLEGGAGNDILRGSSGSDTLVGGRGNDTLDGGDSDTSYGSADVADYSTAQAAVTVNLSTGTATGRDGSDKLIGIEIVVGSDFADTLIARKSNYSMLQGGAGADTLVGGDFGMNIFLYLAVEDSTMETSDCIRNFQTGASGLGVMDLWRIDADTSDRDNDEFMFVGLNGFSGVAGELRYENTATDTYVYADVNGDRAADLAIKLVGVLNLNAGSFHL